MKIYTNRSCMIFSTNEKTDLCTQNKLIFIKWRGNTSQFLQMMDLMEKSQDPLYIHCLCTDVQLAFKEFATLFNYVEAAGGIIVNGQQQLLLIFRNGMWDLPKGKMEKNETPEETALRECIEETGVLSPRITGPCCSTLHSYRLKEKKRYLKRTYWFGMHTSSNHVVVQHEEGIEKAEWVLQSNVYLYTPVYPLVADLLKETTW